MSRQGTWRKASLDNDQTVTLEVDDIARVERLDRSWSRLLKLIGKHDRPDTPPLRPFLSFHLVDYLGGPHRSHMWEMSEQWREKREVMVSMAMSDEDCPQGSVGDDSLDPPVARLCGSRHS